jgi:hypothetical protein
MKDENTRVTLQYSITLDELPSEVKKLSDKISKSQFSILKNLIARMSTLSKQEIVSENLLNNIALVRDSLSDMDHIASDIQNIVSGYIEMNQTPQPQEEAPVQVPTHLVDPLHLEPTELVEKMRLFRDKQVIDGDQEPTASSKE